ncbi:MAG: DbpA RNA binding domain-containing protein [Thermoanaerobaculia bacterium]
MVRLGQRRQGPDLGRFRERPLSGPQNVGSIQIAERFSLVEVPEKIADSVMRALRGTMIRGQKVIVRRDKDAGR